MKIKAEYIWLDGNEVPQIRSKTKILNIPEETSFENYKVPEWSFDGSSTLQAEREDSDCFLKPVKIYKDPIRGKNNILVLNEVYLPSGKPHSTNHRHKLKKLLEKHANDEWLIGVEQEYTFMKLDGTPYGFFLPEEKMKLQGDYYCGVGADKIFGRQIVEKHMDACLEAELVFEGVNWEVMPGQCEYQIGPADPLTVADDLIIARYLLNRIAEDYGIVVSLHPKPAGEGKNWNGAGCHTNFSTKAMRESSRVFEEVIEKLKNKHEEHISVYGKDIEQRLTGLHETCSYKEFKVGKSDRGASIRIPARVALEGKGYLEDRRPCANVIPYLAFAKLIETVS